MTLALDLARACLGATWPNPAVGCLLVRDSQVVGRGQTAPGGRPHAEQMALALAGEEARGAVAYVTLEPCAHKGETPACAGLLAEAGITRCLYAIDDPDPRVSGKGAAMLQDFGVEVRSGLMAGEARDLNQGFFLRMTEKRPMVTLKLATSADGKIAGGGGQWITGEPAREYGHKMRACHDAILVGLGTVLADDPLLTCRLAGLEERSPVRIILDSSLRTPLAARLVQSAGEVPVWIVSNKARTAGMEAAKEKFQMAGVKILPVANCRDIQEVLGRLADEGLTRLMVEGGAKINAAFLASGFVDHVAWFRAPVKLGAEALAAAGETDLATVLGPPVFRLASRAKIGDDVLEKFIATR